MAYVRQLCSEEDWLGTIETKYDSYILPGFSYPNVITIKHRYYTFFLSSRLCTQSTLGLKIYNSAYGILVLYVTLWYLKICCTKIQSFMSGILCLRIGLRDLSNLLKYPACWDALWCPRSSWSLRDNVLWLLEKTITSQIHFNALRKAVPKSSRTFFNYRNMACNVVQKEIITCPNQHILSS